MKQLNDIDITDVSMIDHQFCDDIVSDIKQNYEEFMLSCFEYLGMSKDFVIQHAGEYYVEIMGQVGNNSTSTYYYKGKKLFSITEFREQVWNENKVNLYTYQLSYHANFYEDEEKAYGSRQLRSLYG